MNSPQFFQWGPTGAGQWVIVTNMCVYAYIYIHTFTLIIFMHVYLYIFIHIWFCFLVLIWVHQENPKETRIAWGGVHLIGGTSQGFQWENLRLGPRFNHQKSGVPVIVPNNSRIPNQNTSPCCQPAWTGCLSKFCGSCLSPSLPGQISY